jgi:hypothetical protein
MDQRTTAGPLDEQRAAERNAILLMMDAQSCGYCGKTVPPGAADDPEWFIDVEGYVDDQGEPFEIALIRCPECR